VAVLRGPEKKVSLSLEALNAKGVASYRKANPGSKLKTAVTTKPSKLKSGSKAAKEERVFALVCLE
jgi:hypothetical protein